MTTKYLRYIDRVLFFILNRFAKVVSSAPFLSPDTFKSIADFSILGDRVTTAELTALYNSRVIYCKTDFLDFFFDEVAQHLVHPFILISGDSDFSIGLDHFHRIPPNLIHWFAQNLLEAHPKVTPLPIGLENLNKVSNGNVFDIGFLRTLENFCQLGKKRLLVYGFNPGTNYKKRIAIIDILKRSPIAENILSDSPYSYRRKLVAAKFVISPPGNGDDCHRTWEALYLKTIPICEESHLTRYFYELGIPILLVQDWRQVLEWDRSYLERKYEELRPRFQTSFLWSAKWKRKIYRGILS